MWCETAPCAKETKATAIVEDFLVRGVSGLVAGYIGSEGAECWSCTGYAFCHCAAPSRHNAMAQPNRIVINIDDYLYDHEFQEGKLAIFPIVISSDSEEESDRDESPCPSPPQITPPDSDDEDFVPGTYLPLSKRLEDADYDSDEDMEGRTLANPILVSDSSASDSDSDVSMAPPRIANNCWRCHFDGPCQAHTPAPPAPVVTRLDKNISVSKTTNVSGKKLNPRRFEVR